MASRLSRTARQSPKTAGRASRGKRRASALAVCFIACLAGPVAADTVLERFYPPNGEEIRLPYPFAELIADLARKSGGAESKTAFIPLGRSLQRYAADPDFFQSPRVVSGLIGEGTGDVAVKDRLYLGYQPASQAIEIIAFDETLGRFMFSEVTNYGAQAPAVYRRMSDVSCTGCHQAKAPIFAAAPWSESNANSAVVAKLPGAVAGLTVAQDFDGVDQLDRSTRRANRIAVAALLWREGCATRDCRTALLNAALAVRSGKPIERGPDFVGPLAARWPAGLAFATPKIPDRDPVAMLHGGNRPVDVIEALGAFDPETPREPQTYWSPGASAAEQAARLVAELFTPPRLQAELEELSQ